MTKVELVGAIAKKTGFSKAESVEILEDLFEIIKRTLEAEDEVKIVGFGKFEVKRKQERLGRNPQTGEGLTIEPRKIVVFKASQMLKDAVNAPMRRAGAEL